MRSLACGPLVVLCATAFGCGGQTAPAGYRCHEVAGSHHAFGTKSCPSGVPDDPEISCGTLALAEDPDAERSCLVELAWVRYEPREPSDEVPVLVLGGGPGQAMVERTQEVVAVARQVAPGRTFVIHDPRGVGASTPRLDCSQVGPVDGDVGAAWAECARTYREGGHDARRYRTEVLAADLDALAEGFGFEQVDLFGVSYGSRLAYAYASMYPSRARALLLDAATPLDAHLLERPVAGYVQALANVFADCAVSPSCSARHAEVAAAHDATLARLAVDPPSIELGEGRLPLLPQLYVGMTTELAAEQPALLPAFVSAVARGDYAPVLQRLRDPQGSALAAFTYHAIMCSEELPQNARARAADDLSALPAYAPVLLYDVLAEHCEDFGLAPAPDAEPAWRGRVEPLGPDVPVLALTGRYDPLSVAGHWASTALPLPDGSLIDVPDAGHGARRSPCGAALASRFLADPMDRPTMPPSCTRSLDFFAEELPAE